jgi:DNA-binding transcriptional LysR family regulator
MVAFHKKLPPLKSLLIFEAAARLRSFTLAAAELGVTQGAVSLQIRQLERDLGVPLFLRFHRRVALTAEGSDLAEVLGSSFTRIADTLARMQPEDEHQLTVATTVALSHFWLLPRIPEFRALMPGLSLRIVSQDEPVDFAVEDIDVAISYSDSPFPSGKAEFLWSEEVFPVCTPAFAERYGDPQTLEQLLALPLISADARERSWITWDHWFARLGLPNEPRSFHLRFNHYTDAIYAAGAGEGVALGWRHLIGDALSQGRLVRLSPFSVTPPGAYHVLLPDRRPARKSADTFVAWLHAVTAAWQQPSTVGHLR